MVFYIKYPKDWVSNTKFVKIVKTRPRPSKNYGFAEGSFKDIKSVCYRLNHMNVPNHKRPKKFRC